jgi:hypothetical protein
LWLDQEGLKCVNDQTNNKISEKSSRFSSAASASVNSSFERRLCAFFSHQIRSDVSSTYGDGFRKALDAFQRNGGKLTLLVGKIRQTGTL